MELPVYDDDILLYTMEKCGTTTILNTVKSAGIEIGRATRLNIKSLPFENKKIITVARDPVEWAISYYCEMPDAHPEDIPDPDGFGNLWHFYETMDILYPAKWFIDYFREIIGVNVYSKWFRKRLGWEIYSLGRVLVLVTHHLTDTLIPALAAFTERPASDFILHPQEKTIGEKRFGDRYIYLHKFVKFYRTWFIDYVADSQYCKHFFSLEERKRMVDRWTI